MKCYLIRHGKIQENLHRLFAGRKTDSPLLQEGIDALARIDDVSERSILFVSPMLRARQTADIMLPGLQQNVIDDLSEMDFGIFEGFNNEGLSGNELFQTWLDSGGTMQIPEGESLDMFNARTLDAFRKAVRIAADDDADEIYIIAHGGTIMAVMSTLTGEFIYNFNVPNGMGYCIELETDDDGNITSAGSYNSFCGGLRAGSDNR